jgi:hypothetical protein
MAEQQCAVDNSSAGWELERKTPDMLLGALRLNPNPTTSHPKTPVLLVVGNGRHGAVHMQGR